jgi:tetratricopeptide (TPR) repeat protein
MYIRKVALFALACMLPLSAALACGPDFPQNLLDDRKASLFDLPDGTFEFEAAQLLPKPDDHLRAVEGSPWDDTSDTRTKAEAIGLSADELKTIEAMRAAPNSDAAAAAGAGLAPELLDYTLGAIAFKAGDRAAAGEHFERVLALSPVQRPRRGLWAQYMLGRVQVASNDTDFAIASFGQARARALAGAADPLGLAVASYGEQARIHWHRGNVVAAVALYAQQAAHGSRSGRASLLFVARSLLAHPDMLDKALSDPLSQRLLAAYFYTRSNEFAQDWPAAGTKVDADASDAAAEHKSATSVDVEGFLAAVEHHGLDHFDGADRMAAGAYRAGRYPLAAQLAAKSTTPLAAWVRAKLALRAGDQATALREYAQAAKGFPVDESWGGDNVYSGGVESPRCRVETERGVLALGRGEYLDAMERMYAGAKEHWPDAAYVAERVLTVDELQGFVEKNAPVALKKAATAQGDSLPSTPPEQLRALLARRLLRVGRDDEALVYFDDPALHAKAVALIAARRAGSAWTRNARSEALFKQAQLTRKDGMELLGTELAPDAVLFDGSYGMQAFPLTPANFVSTGEPARVNASAVVPDQRFHYRYVAAGLAEQAAALVPARSQAYAALMCQAASWVIDTDAKRASTLYRRYLREGAHVGWGKDFGRVCPAPDFAAARWVPWKQRYHSVRHWVRHEWPFALCGLGLAIIVLAMLRRRRYAA